MERPLPNIIAGFFEVSSHSKVPAKYRYERLQISPKVYLRVLINVAKDLCCLKQAIHYLYLAQRTEFIPTR